LNQKIHPVRVPLGKGAENEHHLKRQPVIRDWAVKEPPIKADELRAYGPLFLAIELHAINQEI
jgi:hypothetical protein